MRGAIYMSAILALIYILIDTKTDDVNKVLRRPEKSNCC